MLEITKNKNQFGTVQTIHSNFKKTSTRKSIENKSCYTVFFQTKIICLFQKMGDH